MSVMKIDRSKCTGCGLCVGSCPFNGIELNNSYASFTDNCTACGICVDNCPFSAITKPEKQSTKVDTTDWQGVWVYAQIQQGKLEDVTLQLLGVAKNLANDLETSVGVVVVGDNTEEAVIKLKQSVADDIYIVSDNTLREGDILQQTAILTELVQKYKPEIFLMGATPDGRSLAPRVAARLKTGLTADCTELSIDTDKRLLIQTRPAFGGNLMAQIVCPNNRPQMATVRPGVFPILKASDKHCANVHNINVAVPQNTGIEILDFQPASSEGSSIETAEIIVAAGRGVGSKENLQLIYELAHELNGAVAGTRPLVDAGWLDYNVQVGQTGRTIAPKLYIACGISGAVQHLAGIAGAETVVAINTDAEAPIFDRANYGIVGDVAEVVKELLKKLRG